MKYTSTRRAVMVDETYALLHGLAEDGGLYVPSTFPSNSLTYEMIANKSYQEIAVIVLEKLFTSFLSLIHI